MAHHHGMRKKTRDKLSKTVRSRGISPVVRAIQNFEQGSKVHVLIDSSIHKGMPHPKFHGRTGEVLGKRGRAFVISVSDGNATKTLIVLPEHLRKQENEEQLMSPGFRKLYKKAVQSVDKTDRIRTMGGIIKLVSEAEKSGKY